MSGLSTVSPLSPIEQRDFRSTSTKRSRDHTSKWSMGVRPPRGYYWSVDDTTGAEQAHKIRPMKIQSSPKHRQNKNSDSSGYDRFECTAAVVTGMNRMNTADHTATETAFSPLTKSLIELLPPDARTSSPSIQTIPADIDVLYSFDNKGASPGINANEVHLEGLVEQAEKKWVSQMTEKIVKGEYEVLDEMGEKTSLAISKKGKRSPKQKAVKIEPAKALDEEDEDGFELI